MEWRIRSSSHGGFYAELGCQHNGGEHISGMIGATMPAFIVYESHRFDTEQQAKSFIRKNKIKGEIHG